MDTYTLLREFADSWFLIVMFSFFMGIWVYAFWPSLQSARESAANIPFLEDQTACAKNCDTCICNTDFLGGTQDG
ncbi:MAG: cbb3-type cytochrome c oxidase subunit 3 [Pseudomonadota bacterium]